MEDNIDKTLEFSPMEIMEYFVGISKANIKLMKVILW